MAWSLWQVAEVGVMKPRSCWLEEGGASAEGGGQPRS
jgi:hypothetical protein